MLLCVCLLFFSIGTRVQRQGFGSGDQFRKQGMIFSAFPAKPRPLQVHYRWRVGLFPLWLSLPPGALFKKWVHGLIDWWGMIDGSSCQRCRCQSVMSDVTQWRTILLSPAPTSLSSTYSKYWMIHGVGLGSTVYAKWMHRWITNSLFITRTYCFQNLWSHEFIMVSEMA